MDKIKRNRIKPSGRLQFAAPILWLDAVLRNLDTKEFEEANALYREHFGESIPTEQISGTIHELLEIVNRSLEEGKNLLPEHYGWQQGDLY